MNFNEHLLRIRTASHQTQQALADYLNISVQSVSKWEKGTASPSIEYLPQIARFFHCSVNAFFSEYELQLTEKFAAPLDDKYVLALYEEILHQQNVLKSNPEWPDTEFVDNAYPFESMFLPGLYEFLKTHILERMVKDIKYLLDDTDNEQETNIALWDNHHEIAEYGVSYGKGGEDE